MTAGLMQRTLLLLFALSGFSGLIYESVWSHYLKIFLGHAAYAQALVLIIFMGGMSIGAWLISRTTHRISNLLLAYALVEGIVGVFGLIFHNAFLFVNTASFETIIPVLGSPFLVQLYKFITASILILPQSILLGATFPLMCGGFIRKYQNIPGKTISLLYFSNSAGAVIALLLSTFYFIGKFGLPGTIFSAGILNIAIAIIIYFISKESPSKQIHHVSKSQNLSWPWLIIFASFFTGMASFIYEVTWIRMLSMVLSASTHAFELMLSAFITGLAIGGYWIRKKIDNINNTVLFAGTVQIMMGLFAFLTIFLYNFSFEIMSFLISALNKTDQGYILFNITSHSIALLIMLPATICAGMTLPLFTFMLLQQNYGEKSIGLIYSSNTVGAIIGVIFTIYIGMPVLGLKGSLLTGAMIDIIVGLFLLRILIQNKKPHLAIPSICILILIFIVTATFYQFDTSRMASGVFRHGFFKWENGTNVLSHEDGKTASISVMSHKNDVILIATNGKPDASITINKNEPPTLDEITMKLLAALPLSIHPSAKIIANIGMGSGLTTHTALISPHVEHIDTIEIEEAMVRGAKYFLPETKNAFDDPRSKIVIDDARTFFSTQNLKYDIIISEPSNPWVSGVSSLFTEEFYRSTSQHLNQNGIFAQWIHTYEFSLDLLISVLKSLSSAFPYYSIYFTDTSNIILIASLDQPVPYADASIFNSQDMSKHLAEIDITNIEDINFRFLGDQELYEPFITSYPVPVNSDYYPILDLRAPKQRFLREDIQELFNIRLSSFPILDFLYEKDSSSYQKLTISNYTISTMKNASDAYNIYSLFENDQYIDGFSNQYSSLKYLNNFADKCEPLKNDKLWTESLFYILESTLAYLRPNQIQNMLNRFTPDCDSTILSIDEQNWLALFDAIALRDFLKITSISNQLLNSNNAMMDVHKKYIYTSLIVSLIKLDEFHQAANIWNQEFEQLFNIDGELPLEITLLLALINKNIASD
ncbi:MAG: spermidine synthase [Gammaproteobacteria bacterium]|jgi:spermidine synthase